MSTESEVSYQNWSKALGEGFWNESCWWLVGGLCGIPHRQMGVKPMNIEQEDEVGRHFKGPTEATASDANHQVH